MGVPSSHHKVIYDMFFGRDFFVLTTEEQRRGSKDHSEEQARDKLSRGTTSMDKEGSVTAG